MEVLADTSYLIDAQRGDRGAIRWTAENPGMTLYLCATTYAEYRAGLPSREAAETLIGALPTLETDFTVAELWGFHSRSLQSVGLMIGQNDLWIACTALRHGLPIVTRNAREFSRVPGLMVLSY